MIGTFGAVHTAAAQRFIWGLDANSMFPMNSIIIIIILIPLTLPTNVFDIATTPPSPVQNRGPVRRSGALRHASSLRSMHDIDHAMGMCDGLSNGIFDSMPNV